MDVLYKEILEQPDILRNLLTAKRTKAESIAAALTRRDPDFAFLAARGTSDNAGRYANYLWSSVNRLPLALATPSVFTYYGAPPRLRNALVVGVSQSGQSPDIVSVVEEGRRQGSPTLVITNAPDSPMANAAEHVFDIQAGQELAVAATKSYTAELMAIAMLSAAMVGDPERWQQLESVPEWIAETIGQDSHIASLAQRYRYMDNCVVLGRGFNYATAFEWALKIKELVYIQADPYSSADFLHGPIALVSMGFPILAVAPAGMVFDAMHETLVKLAQERRAELVVISDREEALALAKSPIRLPQGIPEWLTPLVSIVAAQLFTYHLTVARGYDPDNPRGLQKVTETH